VKFSSGVFTIFVVLMVGIGVAWSLNFIRMEIFTRDKGEDIGLNLSVEILGFVISTTVTIVIIDQLARNRTEIEFFNTLVTDMGGDSNEFAKRAVRLLRQHHKAYLTAGALIGLDFSGANLEGANLEAAHLEGVNLFGANLRNARLTEAYLDNGSLSFAHLEDAVIPRAHLEGADLSSARLESAVLFQAHLESADLSDAHLQAANLSAAHLEGAILRGTHLEGANLRLAHLQGASLLGTSFDSSTILPDGEHWTKETDMRRFTHPDRPGFFTPPSS